MKENQRIVITKRMLKEGLLRLLETKTLDKIHISELCAEAGVNRATFYRHYQTPYDVLMELELDFARGVSTLSRSPKSMQEAEKDLEAACAYMYEHADIVRTLLRCNTANEVELLLNNFFKRFWELRKDQPGFAELDEMTVRAITTMLGGGAYCLLRQWILEDIPKTPKEIAAIMCSVIRWPDPSAISAAT